MPNLEAKGRPAAPPHVVFIGAGFGGLSAAKEVAGSALAVTLIDRHNYHRFQPLLYQVATAGLAPSDIAFPVRGIHRHAPNLNAVLAKVSGVDVERGEVIAEGRRFPFDHHIVARPDQTPTPPPLLRSAG
jgi:NADH dehydrogenase